MTTKPVHNEQIFHFSDLTVNRHLAIILVKNAYDYPDPEKTHLKCKFNRLYICSSFFWMKQNQVAVYTFEKNTPSSYLGVESRWDPGFYFGDLIF